MLGLTIYIFLYILVTLLKKMINQWGVTSFIKRPS